MQWWAWLIIGVLVALVVILLIFLLREKTAGLTKEEKTKLSTLESEKLKGELEFEKDKSNKLKDAFMQQQARIVEIKQWYENEKNLIKKASRDDFEKYIGNVDAAGAEFDRIVGICSKGIKSPDD